MIEKLENSDLSIKVASKGAELTSLINKETESELLWQADSKFWGRHSPILFPNVGRQYKDQYSYGGKSYPSSQHGFARDKDFTLIEKTENSLSFRLEADDETKAIYPFDFSLTISYTLNEKTLAVSWEVENRGDEKLFFTIGAHPAFNTAPEKRDYCLYFPGKSVLYYKRLNTDYGCVVDERNRLDLIDGILQLSDMIFREDALIFDDSQISECILERDDGEKILKLNSPGFPNYGIWSKEGAPFVCLEPWYGRADDMDFEGDISTKKGITALKPGENFKIGYEIEVY